MGKSSIKCLRHRQIIVDEPVVVDVVADFPPDVLEGSGAAGEVDSCQMRRGSGHFAEDRTVRRHEVDHASRDASRSAHRRIVGVL